MSSTFLIFGTKKNIWIDLSSFLLAFLIDNQTNKSKALLILICRFLISKMQSPNFFASTRELSRPDTSLNIHARRTEAQDVKRAKDLVQSYTMDVFGRVDREENISSIL